MGSRMGRGNAHRYVDREPIKNTVGESGCSTELSQGGMRVGMMRHTFSNPRLIIEEMSLPVGALQKRGGEQGLWIFLNTVSI